ncbi:hypothetical protein AVU03_gp43 [Escherichia phage slur05]|uniref:Uncharacterized protein n=1 Tax=Escherichia phage slur05 TaxID=1720498 RepID=A0A0M7QA89_9CAUD|nr:hypothetical protein AVU03_gp43 [Escherichia phage slur05]CUL02181.1 hypothetical protein [Escherichia phage slur05]CUL02236.1 hypothetical protein [Escherichia phage slur06]
MTPMQITLMAGYSQEFIDLVSCYDDYTHYGIATVCDGDNLTADELDEVDDYTTEELCALMCGVPVWAKESPLAADGDNMYRYRK